MKNVLLRKLMVIFFVVFFCAIGGLTYFAYLSSRDAMLYEFKVRGHSLAKAIASESRTYYHNRDVEGFTTLLQSLGETEDVLAILTYRSPKTLWIEFAGVELTPEDLPLRETVDTWQQDKVLTKGHIVTEFGMAVVGLTKPSLGGGQETVSPLGWIRVFLDRRALEQRLDSLVFRTLLISGLTIMLGGVVFIWLLRQSLHVIGPLTAATKKVAQGDLRAIVPVSSQDELGELAQAFNSMTEQLLTTTVSKNYMDNLIRSMIDSLIVVNPDGTIRSVNQATLQLLGYEEQELLGQQIDILFPKKEGWNSGKMKEAQLQKGGIALAETMYRTKDGRTIPMLLSEAVMRNENGSVQGIIRVGKDMTEIKQAEEQLLLHETALESAANAVVITDRKGCITWANPSFTSLTGYSLEEVVGQDMRILKSGRHDHAFYQNLWDTILSGKVWQGEVINRKKDGSLYTEEETITPVYDQNREISHFIGIKQDVTERKRGEETIRQAHETLKELDQLRSQFFSDISHEIRTPLTVIRGEAEVTLRGKEKPVAEYKTVLERIVQLTNQVNKLVGDLLFLSRSESGTIEIVKHPLPLLDLLEEVYREALVLAEKKHIAVTLNSRDDTPIIVNGDPQRLRQLFMIIIDNAVNYTKPRGAIEVDMESDGASARVVVADNGVGIPEEDLPHVFQRFYRVKQGRQDVAQSGSGLGLHIAKWIAETHMGTVSIASVLDRGTTVTIELPLHGSKTLPADR
jgi:PAS domain S-box-containing protein